jgi:hypothetical protein
MKTYPAPRLIALFIGTALLACWCPLGGAVDQLSTSSSGPPTSSAPDIFAHVSPSVAFIETPAGTGSGVMIDGGYVATCAHVVWPFTEARVVFPDGTEFMDAPVLDWDMMADLAIIGPIKTRIEPMPLSNGEGLAIGSEVFLIGYPGEAELFPQPAISRGILSRLREWEQIGMTYLQTDADISGGQSGGVLVSEAGEVIGITCYSFDEAFALPVSARDVSVQLKKLIDGQDVDGLGKRPLPTEGGQVEHEDTLENFWDERTYVLNEPWGTSVEIKASSNNDVALLLLDVYGMVVMETDEETTGTESGSATTEMDAPYFLIVGQSSDEPGAFELTSSHELIPYEDADDHILLSVGETIQGGIDYPGDLDVFIIDLESGQTVDVIVDSMMIDPYVLVDYPDAPEEEVVADDDSGRGPFGTAAWLTYTAPQMGSYYLVVRDSYDEYVGGYFLTVTPAP